MAVARPMMRGARVNCILSRGCFVGAFVLVIMDGGGCLECLSAWQAGSILSLTGRSSLTYT